MDSCGASVPLWNAVGSIDPYFPLEGARQGWCGWFCALRSAQPEHLDPFPNATAGTFFSGVFSDGAVLQRAPRSARLFGVVIGATDDTTFFFEMNTHGTALLP